MNIVSSKNKISAVNELFCNNLTIYPTKTLAPVTEISPGAFAIRKKTMNRLEIKLPNLERFRAAIYFELDCLDLSACNSLKALDAFVFPKNIKEIILPNACNINFDQHSLECGYIKELYLDGKTALSFFESGSHPRRIENLYISNVDRIPCHRFTNIKINNLIIDNVNIIRHSAFVSCGIESLKFCNCENLTLIEQNAFIKNNLESVDLPPYIAYIGRSAFDTATKINNISPFCDIEF